ncbi:hypothetical protein A6A28_16640 [Streptomyces sp. CB03578]|nr:hypothetical protein A6A28_16640 [Streptomyces sp. CB03578]
MLVSSASVHGDGTPEETRDQDLLTVRQVRDLTHVDDITEGTLHALTSSVRRMENHLLSRRPQAPSRTGSAATCAGFDRDGPVQIACGVGLREQRGERLRPGAVGLPHIRSRLWAPFPDPKMPGQLHPRRPGAILNAIASITCR